MIESKRHRGWVLVLVLLALLLATLVWFWRASFPDPVTNPKRYAEILQAWRSADQKYVGHFPLAVPPSASDVRMHFDTGPLQAPALFEIRYTLPTAEFETEAIRARGLTASRRPSRRPKPSERTYTYTSFRTDRKSDGPTTTRESLTVGVGGIDPNDRWGITLDPTRNEICYWVIDD